MEPDHIALASETCRSGRIKQLPRRVLDVGRQQRVGRRPHMERALKPSTAPEGQVQPDLLLATHPTEANAGWPSWGGMKNGTYYWSSGKPHGPGLRHRFLRSAFSFLRWRASDW